MPQWSKKVLRIHKRVKKELKDMNPSAREAILASVARSCERERWSFIIHDPGDRSVGIWPFTDTVAIEIPKCCVPDDRKDAADLKRALGKAMQDYINLDTTTVIVPEDEWMAAQQREAEMEERLFKSVTVSQKESARVQRRVDRILAKGAK